MLKKSMIAVACSVLFISGCAAEKSEREKSVAAQDAVQGSADDSTKYTQAVEVVQDVGPDGRPIDPVPATDIGEDMEDDVIVVEE
ncbi:hypothetical protein [Psychrobacter sp. AOP22-C2-15]|uniref:hypothetical protein n=1 Tax=Psychrobacter sp. AOP22-C2-15 TaxID=3457715 RepID=UPI0040361F04